MAQPVLHQPRLAWDGARVFVRVLGSEHLYTWFSERFGLIAGPAGQQALLESCNRLWFPERLDAPQAEAGMWRVRLEDLLQAHPDLGAPLQDLIHEAAARLTVPRDRMMDKQQGRK
jgi:hypothetical protein